MGSKSGALLALLAWALLTMVAMAQDTDSTWWVMADSENSKAVCPGRCLAVNDSATGASIENKRVGFVACKATDSSSSDSGSSSSTPSFNNQQWLLEDDITETTIQINATDDTDTPSTPKLLCLQPDLATGNRSLTVTKCIEGGRNQKWNVSNNSILSLAFDPPRYLAMTYRLSGFLEPTDGTTAWREALIVQSKAKNSSLTTTFSTVDSTVEPQLPQPPPVGDETQANFIRNGGFEVTSFDFPRSVPNLTLNQNDIFGLCEWQIMKTEANIQDDLNSFAAEGNRSLYLKDGIVKQKVITSRSAFYTLTFMVRVATPSPADDSANTGDGSNTCNGSDILAVNPFPSTNVHFNVDVSNGSWATRHVSFQALGKEVMLSLRGCATCGCFVDDVKLMQVIDRAPFPPPPPRPSPPGVPGYIPFPPPDHKPRPDFSKRSENGLPNLAVVGLVVGASALFFLIGAAFFAVVCVKEKKESETEMIRPPEWSITTTPVQSERGRGSINNSERRPDSSNAPTTPTSAPQDLSQHTSSTVGATKYSTSQPSSNPHSGSGV